MALPGDEETSDDVLDAITPDELRGAVTDDDPPADDPPAKRDQPPPDDEAEEPPESDDDEGDLPPAAERDDTDAPEDDDQEEPEGSVEALRAKLQKAQRSEKGLRRDLAKLRRKRRAAQSRPAPVPGEGLPPGPDLPREIPVTVDADGRASVSAEALEAYLAPQREYANQVQQRESAARAQADADAAIERRYNDLKDDVIEGSDDPSNARLAVQRLDLAYQWANENAQSAMEELGVDPRSFRNVDELVDFAEAELGDDFYQHFPEVESLSDLIEASMGQSTRRLHKFMADHVDRVAGLEADDAADDVPRRRPRRRRSSVESVKPRPRSMARKGRSGHAPDAGERSRYQELLSADQASFSDADMAEFEKLADRFGGREERAPSRGRGRRRGGRDGRYGQAYD